MSYQWSLDAQALFGERYPQMVSLGLPESDVDAVRAAITDMWVDAPGGWVYEWSELASRYAKAGSHQLASLAYGWAKFPTLADDAKRTALTRQLEQYLLAAPGFGVDFQRQILDVAYQGETTPVPVHILTPPGLDTTNAPVVIASGGVDGWKMDVHTLLVFFAATMRVRVLSFDIAGTGESVVPMTPDGGAEIVRGLIGHARTLGNGVVAHIGVSMGGYYSARSGLAGEVDAAIVLGGPVEEAFDKRGAGAFGMGGIVGNALGFDREPTADEQATRFGAFSLRSLLDQDINSPMLVLNGADDVHVPRHDTQVFQGRRDTRSHLIPDTGHCAVSKMPEALQVMSDWLGRTLSALSAGAHQ
ncbi:alpha/beta hydrolase [Nocardia vinacea]|uniref:alpha/beta fold hydrolase n=1 Tax=Nocardia vinacea TaxID=96468 RepID=UPI002E146C7C|nr:alpha/beta hydrolase [Nocardia vinacea]